MIGQVSGTLAAPVLSGEVALGPLGWRPPVIGEFTKAQAGQVTWPQVSQSWPLDTAPLSPSLRSHRIGHATSGWWGVRTPELTNQDVHGASESLKLKLPATVGALRI